MCGDQTVSAPKSPGHASFWLLQGTFRVVGPASRCSKASSNMRYETPSKILDDSRFRPVLGHPDNSFATANQRLLDASAEGLAEH